VVLPGPSPLEDAHYDVSFPQLSHRNHARFSPAVFPPPADHPLLHEPRILVTPHTGWYSEDANYDVRVRAAEEVVRVLRGERPRCPVNEIAPAQL